MLKIDNGQFKYENLLVFDQLNIDVKASEVYCILGPSGCGKSTLLNVVSGLRKMSGGTITVKSERLGYVFQDDRLLPWLSVMDNIKVVDDTISDARAKDILKDMGLSGFENSLPNELSGGMRQRVSIARAFAYRSDLLLMDEPFKSIDYQLRLDMINHLIQTWEHHKNTIIYVTHDIDEALLLGDKVAVFSERPSHVLKTLTINTPRKERHLEDRVFTALKQQLIHYMTRSE